MSARVLTLPANAPAPKSNKALDARQVRITSDKAGTVVLPWWPDDIAWGGMSATYESQDRPGRTPLLLRSGIGLEELRIGTVIRPRDLEGAAGAGQSTTPTVATMLDSLRKMSRAANPVTVALAGRSGRYRITDLGITEIDWDTSGAPIVAEVSLTMSVASDAVVPVGPIKGKGKK